MSEPDEDFVDLNEQEIRERLGKLGTLVDAHGERRHLDDLVWTGWGGAVFLKSWAAACCVAKAFNSLCYVDPDKGLQPAYVTEEGLRKREDARVFAVVESKYRREYEGEEITIIGLLADFFDRYVKMDWARRFLKANLQEGKA